MLQQYRAVQRRISEAATVAIPGYVFSQTPTRRFTTGEGSYLFDADIWVESSDAAQSVSVFIEYDAVFQTPQPAATTGSTLAYRYSTGQSATDTIVGFVDAGGEIGHCFIIPPGRKAIGTTTFTSKNASRQSVHIVYAHYPDSDSTTICTVEAQTTTESTTTGYTITDTSNYQGDLILTFRSGSWNAVSTGANPIELSPPENGLTIEIENITSVPVRIGFAYTYNQTKFYTSWSVDTID